ncbi:TonB-dependent receptor domain-containing protein [Thalassospira tepidiphila]|uniref:TonB-dependent receptor n=1 Tax=Thalassospira tepidiphila TaxID=393657 RepID=UPI003AA96611
MMGDQLSVVAGKWRHRLVLTTALSVLALPVIGSQAGASEKLTANMLTTDASRELAQASATHSFDIAPQMLADALALFGQQAGVQVSADGELVRGVETSGVSGEYQTEDALQRLLAGTGLTFRIATSGAITITGSAQSSANDGDVLAPVIVEANAISDDHAGAADRASSIYVTKKDLERRNPQDVKQVFGGESGVSVGGSVPLSQKVYVNGVEETNLAVSIDGARQNNKVFHHNGTTLIDPALLKAARVDPGVAPADAGPAALGGSIVYETVDVGDLLAPDRTLGGFAVASFDTNGGRFTNDLSSYGRAGDVELLGYFKWAKGDDFESGDGDQMPGTGSDLRSGLVKGAYEANDYHRFEVSAEQVRDNARRPYRANMSNLTNRNDPAERVYDLARRKFVFNYDTPTADGIWDPRVVMAYSESDLSVPSPDNSEGLSASYSGKVENDFNITDVDKITAGVDFYHDRSKYHDPNYSTDEVATNVGAYGQARLQPLDPLRLSFGLRGDRQAFEGIDGTEIDLDGVSGNASVAFDATDFLTLKAGYSNVWGGIALAESFLHNPSWDYSKGVKAVRAENYTTGFEAHYDGFTFSGDLFRGVFDNVRNPTYNGGPSLYSDFETRGYGFGVGYNWGAGFARLNYTDTEITVNGGSASSYDTQYLGAPLGRIFALEVGHTFEDLNLRVGGTGEAALKNTDTQDAGGLALEAYEVVGLYAEYKPSGADFLTLRAEVNNLFDENYASRGTYGQDFTTVEPLYEPGRSFLLQAKATF